MIGIGADDSKHEADWLAGKLLALKVFPDDREGEVWGWKKSVVEAEYEVLCGASAPSRAAAFPARELTLLLSRSLAQSRSSRSRPTCARAQSPTFTAHALQMSPGRCTRTCSPTCGGGTSPSGSRTAGSRP